MFPAGAPRDGGVSVSVKVDQAVALISLKSLDSAKVAAFSNAPAMQAVGRALCLRSLHTCGMRLTRDGPDDSLLA